MRFLFSLLLPLTCICVSAQEIQNNLSYRNIAAPRYFRVNYENDLAFHTDYYFTQGVHFELVSPGIRKLPTHLLFFSPKGTVTRYGLGLESAGYTPLSIFSDSILYDDRPFAGMAYAKAFATGVNPARSERYAAALSIGLMGPAAGGYEIQAYIHRHTGNADPMGWKYQVGNAIILNYELNYERALLMRRRILLSFTGTARAGTYSTKAAIGGVLMAGLFANPFRLIAQRPKKQAYLYIHPQVDAVGYDASMQGGLFTDNSPYTLSSKEIIRAVFRCDGGLRASYKGIALGAYLRYLTKEFSTGLNHATGGIELAFEF